MTDEELYDLAARLGRGPGHWQDVLLALRDVRTETARACAELVRQEADLWAVNWRGSALRAADRLEREFNLTPSEGSRRGE